MLNAQKRLLAEITAAEKNALAIYNGGAKITGIVQKLRDVRIQLEARVRYLEENTQATTKDGNAPTAPPPVKRPRASKADIIGGQEQ